MSSNRISMELTHTVLFLGSLFACQDFAIPSTGSADLPAINHRLGLDAAAFRVLVDGNV